jgi:RNA polymerase sigma factor (sigma-70 family)
MRAASEFADHRKGLLIARRFTKKELHDVAKSMEKNAMGRVDRRMHSNGVGNNADDALVAAAKEGNAAAFERLVERRRKMVVLMALRITGNREDAEDVAQQSFEKAFVHMHEFRGRSSFSTWLTRIAVNEALMLRRKGRRFREVSLEGSNPIKVVAMGLENTDSESNPENSYFQQEQWRILYSAISELKPGIRGALEICELHERSISEASRILGISATAVKSRLNRGRRMLRRTIECSVALGAHGCRQYVEKLKDPGG